MVQILDAKNGVARCPKKVFCQQVAGASSAWLVSHSCEPWPMPTQPTPPNAIHFTGFSAGSYTAIALEAEYRLLSHRFQQPLCAGCVTLGALGCPLIYLLALLQPHYCAGDHHLVTSERLVGRPALPLAP